jgi:hypothetical protein
MRHLLFLTYVFGALLPWTLSTLMVNTVRPSGQPSGGCHVPGASVEPRSGALAPKVSLVILTAVFTNSE